jgi:drug/metabolite transporter (DMT)-like permease
MPADTQLGTAAEMLCGGALLLILSAIVGEPARLDLSAVSTRSALALGYLVVFGGIISYTAYLWLLRHVDPASVSTNFFVNPVVAVAAGWLVLGEQITPLMLVAAAVIVIGVVVITTRLPGAKPDAAR